MGDIGSDVANLKDMCAINLSKAVSMFSRDSGKGGRGMLQDLVEIGNLNANEEINWHWGET